MSTLPRGRNGLFLSACQELRDLLVERGLGECEVLCGAQGLAISHKRRRVSQISHVRLSTKDSFRRKSALLLFSVGSQPKPSYPEAKCSKFRRGRSREVIGSATQCCAISRCGPRELDLPDHLGGDA
jgi:hypothetical protein